MHTQLLIRVCIHCHSTPKGLELYLKVVIVMEEQSALRHSAWIKDYINLKSEVITSLGSFSSVKKTYKKHLCHLSHEPTPV